MLAAESTFGDMVDGYQTNVLLPLFLCLVSQSVDEYGSPVWSFVCSAMNGTVYEENVTGSMS
jgi:hypothetical protein